MAARRTLALELGATHVIDPTAGDVTAAIRTIHGDGVDHAFDTSGRIDAIQAAPATLAPREMLGLVEVPASADDALPVSVAGMITYGQRPIGIMEGHSHPQTFIPKLIAAHRDGCLPFDRLARIFALAEINEAVAAQELGDCVAVMLLP